MIVAAVVALMGAAQVLCVWLVVRANGEWMRASAAERATLLQRIQDPINAVSLHAAERVVEMEGDHRNDEVATYTLPLDDDDKLNEYIAASEQAQAGWR